jgi:hypothetical protein
MGRLGAGFVRSSPTDTLSMLKDLHNGVPLGYRAARRGHQTSADPGRLGIVSRSRRPVRRSARSWDWAPASSPAISTIPTAVRAGRVDHAWAEILPGAGWITFDRPIAVWRVQSDSVAAARGIAQAMPVTGSFVGMTDAFLGMTVEVDVSSRRPAA